MQIVSIFREPTTSCLGKFSFNAGFCFSQIHRQPSSSSSHSCEERLTMLQAVRWHRMCNMSAFISPLFLSVNSNILKDDAMYIYKVCFKGWGSRLLISLLLSRHMPHSHHSHLFNHIAQNSCESRSTTINLFIAFHVLPKKCSLRMLMHNPIRVNLIRCNWKEGDFDDV